MVAIYAEVEANIVRRKAGEGKVQEQGSSRTGTEQSQSQSQVGAQLEQEQGWKRSRVNQGGHYKLPYYISSKLGAKYNKFIIGRFWLVEAISISFYLVFAQY